MLQPRGDLEHLAFPQDDFSAVDREFSGRLSTCAAPLIEQKWSLSV
jgi:hypothetical protein